MEDEDTSITGQIFERYEKYLDLVQQDSRSRDNESGIIAAMLTIADRIQVCSVSQSFDLMGDLEGVKEALQSIEESQASIASNT